MKKQVLLLFAFLSLGFSAYAQVDTEFWFAAPRLSSHDQAGQFHLMLFSYEKTAHVTVSCPANPLFTPISATVPVNGYTDIPIATTWNDCLGIEALQDSVSNRGFLISSDENIGCYFQVTGMNGESYTLKGRNAYGTEFVVGMQNQYTNSSYSRDALNGIQIVATQNNTTVTITPTVSAGKACTTNPLTIQLNRGETYAYYSCGKSGAEHMTGCLITSNKPIVVNSSDDSVDPGAGGQDLVGEQLVPTSYAGTEYVVVGRKQSWEGFNIIVLQDSTDVTLGDGTSYTNLMQGDIEWVSMSSVDAMYVLSTKPVIVYQITGDYKEAGGTMLPQVECTGSQEVHYKRIPGSSNVYVNIMTKTQNINDFYLNGTAIASSSFSVVPGTNNVWSSASIDASSTPQDSLIRVRCETGIFQMGTIDNDGSSMTYGFFSDYAYKAAVSVRCNGVLITDTICTVMTHSKVYLVAGLAGYVNEYTWSLPNGSVYVGDTLYFDHVQFADSGYYTVNGVGSDCGTEPKTFFFRVIPNPVDTTIVAEICDGDTYSDNGFNETKAGTYIKKYELPNGGDSTVVLQLIVHPKYDIAIEKAICRGDCYIFGNDTLRTAGTYNYSGVSIYGCDSIVRLKLRVDMVAILNEFAETCSSKPYSWYGRSYNSAGTYIYDEPTSESACGYIEHILHLSIIPEFKATVFDSDFTICDGERDKLQIGYQISSGSCDSYSLICTEHAKLHGFDDIINKPFSTPGTIDIEIPREVWPGIYEFVLMFDADSSCGVTNYPIHLTILYDAEEVITQRWNDFLSVRKSAYDKYGGFSDYQWSLNGKLLTGETGTQYYVPEEGLDINGNYSVELTRVVDGVRIRSCDFTPTLQPNTVTLMTITPSIVSAGQNAPIFIRTNEAGVVTMYNQSGVVINSWEVKPGEVSIQAPKVGGLYLLRVQSESGQTDTRKLIVK